MSWEDFKPGEDEIQVLVELPENAAGNKSQQAGQAQSVTNQIGQNIKLYEELHRTQYRLYLERNIGPVLAQKSLCVYGVEKGQNVLSIAKFPGHEDVELSGRADLLILSNIVLSRPRRLELLPEVRMVIEVKQTLRQGAVGQVVSELVALDLLTDYAVMALLTDLNSNWEFYWISESDDSRIRIHTTTVTQPGEAFQVIRTLLEQTPDEGVDITLPFLNVPVKRRKLAQTLPSIVEGREGGGIREAIERYYDIASILGPDIDMARAVANQVVRSIPAFSYYT